MKKVIVTLAVAAALIGAGTTITREAEAAAQSGPYQIVSGAPGCTGNLASLTLKNNTYSFMTGRVWVEMQNQNGSARWSGWIMGSYGGYYKASLVGGGTGSLTLPPRNFNPQWVRIFWEGYGWSRWARSTCQPFASPYFV